MRIVHVFGCLIALAWGSFSAAHAQGAAAERTEPSFTRIAIGTTLGGLVGSAAGLGIAAATRGEGPDGNMFPWAGLALGAVGGSIPGMVVGARIGSGGAGDSLLTSAAAVSGVALGALTGLVVGDLLSGRGAGRSPEMVAVAVGLAIPLALTSATEWRTARRR